jgi:hypothetical protein
MLSSVSYIDRGGHLVNEEAAVYALLHPRRSCHALAGETKEADAEKEFAAEITAAKLDFESLKSTLASAPLKRQKK